jgi:NADPH:quinone reductase-like Zn-dependent oxidoreductase
MAKVARFHQAGGPEVLKVEEVEVGAPGAGEARLRMEAIGLNRAEAMYRQGIYVDQPVFPSLIGYEGAGVIEALGDGVTGFAVGDRVSVMPVFAMSRYGVYGEQAIVPAESLVAVPPGASFIDASAVWMAFITAYGAIVQGGHLARGDAVLLTAGSSSVALAAIQIAHREGLTAIVTTRTQDKKAKLLKAGADHVIVTDDDDLPAEVARITGGRGAALVFDPVAGPYLDTLAQAVAPAGRILVYGRLSPEPSSYTLFPPPPGGVTTPNGAQIRFYTMREVVNDPAAFEAARAYISSGLAEGVFHPVVAKVFDFPAVVEAHRYQESNEQFGKIILRVDH